MNTIKFRTRKVLALLLALAMLFSMMPTSWAYAADSNLVLSTNNNNSTITQNDLIGADETIKVSLNDLSVKHWLYVRLYDEETQSYTSPNIDDISVTISKSDIAEARVLPITESSFRVVEITGKGAGTTTLTVSCGGKNITRTIKVEENLVNSAVIKVGSMSIEKDSISVPTGGYYLFAYPADAEGEVIRGAEFTGGSTFNLSESSAGITLSGNYLKAGAEGTAVVNVTNGKISGTLNVTVAEPKPMSGLQISGKDEDVSVQDIEDALIALGIEEDRLSIKNNAVIVESIETTEADLNQYYNLYGLSGTERNAESIASTVNKLFFDGGDVIDGWALNMNGSYFHLASVTDGTFILSLTALPGAEIEIDETRPVTLTLVNINGDNIETPISDCYYGTKISLSDYTAEDPNDPVTGWQYQVSDGTGGWKTLSSIIDKDQTIVLTENTRLIARHDTEAHYVRIIVLDDDQDTGVIDRFSDGSTHPEMKQSSTNSLLGPNYFPKKWSDEPSVKVLQDSDGEDRDITYEVSLTEYQNLYDGAYSQEDWDALFQFMKDHSLLETNETEFYSVSATQYNHGLAGQDIAIAEDKTIAQRAPLTITIFFVSFWPQPMEITPADVTIYTGGDGYEGAINNNGVSLGTTSGFPEPGFIIEAPVGVANFNPADAELKYNDGTTVRTWNIVPYDGVENATHNIYRFEPAEGTDKTPVRMQFTLADETTVTDDTVNFDELLYEKLTMEVYGQGIDAKQVTLEYSGLSYLIDADTGTLTVRGTSENTETPLVTDPVEEGKAGVEAPEDTTYYINDTAVTVADQSGVALLFDDIIENNDIDGTSNTDMLIEKADETIADLGNDSNLSGSGTRHYECKYLDLVDTNNGNVWVAAEKGVTVSWPLPEGTNKNTKFELIHFPELHREMGVDAVAEDIDQCDTEQVEITNTGTHIEFDVSRAGFSPFVLVWETRNSTGGGGGDDTPELNTTDHFSYIVGYPEDYRTGEPTEDEDLWPVKPQGNITRAEVATIFYRLLKDEVREENWTQSNDYTDVSADDWYNTPVSTLGAMGIVVGYEDGSFRPNAPITRAEFAAIAVRFFEEDSAIYEEGTFSDIAGGEWFADAVQAAKEHGIIGGYPDGSFQPNKNISRAEACSIVNRTLDRIPHEDHLLPVAEMKNWPDNIKGAWYYADMQEATNGHEYEWITDNGKNVENWTGELPEIDWAEVERELCELHGVPYEG